MRLGILLAVLAMGAWAGQAEACHKGCKPRGCHHHHHCGCAGMVGQHCWGCYAWPGYSCMGCSSCADACACSSSQAAAEPTAARKAELAAYAARAARTKQLSDYYTRQTGRVETNSDNLEKFYALKQREAAAAAAVAKRPAATPAMPIARSKPTANSQASTARPVVVAPAKRG